MFRSRSLLLFVLTLIASPSAAEAQEARRAGLPFFSEHFSPEQYGAHHQNFGVVQDPRGIIYVANVNGVLEYDGVSWRTIPTPSSVLSLAVDEDGTVYAGLSGDLGFLRPTPRGDLRYVSLSDQLPRSHRELDRIWTTRATPEGVYFQSREHILRWDGAKFKAWDATEAFHMAFAVDGRYFVREHGVGLLELTEDRLSLVDGGALYANDQIWVMVQQGSEIVVGSRDVGLRRWTKNGFSRFETEGDAYLRQHQLHNGCVLPGDHFAFGTVSGGVVVIGADGRLVDVLDPSRGLPDARVNDVFADAQGGLWMVFNSQGVMRADVISPVTLFNEVLGLQGVVFSMNRRGNALYAATGAGLYEIDLHRRTALRVEADDPALTARLNEVWASENYGPDLLLATTKGLLRLDEVNRVHEITTDRTFTVEASVALPGAIYVGTDEGLELLRFVDGSWERDVRLPLIGAEVREIVEEENGTVWFRGDDSKLYRITAPNSGPVEIRTFSTNDGLPVGRFGVTVLGGSLAVVHNSGVYRYRGAGFSPSFRRDHSFDAPWAREEEVLYALSEDNQGNVWIVYGDRTDILSPHETGYRFKSPDALRLRSEGTGVVDVFVEESGVAWLAYGDNVLRYDPAHDRSYELAYRSLVRRVSPLGEQWDVFGGTRSVTSPADASTASVSDPRLIYDYNDLRFEVAAPSYNAPGRTVYQYYLENHDEGWSNWTSTPVAEYTNLHEGAYLFRVRARNAQGYLSAEGAYAFSILPPWYRTWWSYLAYVSLFATVVALGVHYRRMRLDNEQAQQQARELALERVVNERLTLVNDRLRQADLLKDQLLSNTSHELRTPITAILGFTSVLKDEAPQNMQEFLDIIEENGHRLMRTVTSMVDFARLQAGEIELSREAVEVSREVEQVVSRLAHLARKRQLYFELIQPEDLVHAWLDRKCLERVVENILTNAIKFTEEGGVTVRISADDDSVYIRVQDTGIGMDSDFMPDLFKAFKQESSGLTRSHEGTGLGLAITARLVELMEGEIDVKTSKGAGTVVTISFPVFYVAQPERRPGSRQVSRKSSA